MKKSDLKRNLFMLKGPLAKRGYDWWWHSFTGYDVITGEARSFYIEYFLMNPKHAKKNPVIVWNDILKQKSGIKPSYIMINVGAWGKNKKQLHNFYPWQMAKLKKKELYLEVNDCLLTENHIKGSVKVLEEDNRNHQEWMSDSGSMEWDLKVDKLISYNVGYGASKLFRTINAFEMFWHAKGMKTAYDGYVIFDGKKYIVRSNDCYGYADKNWGGDFTSPWVWLSSNNLYSKLYHKKLENSVFEIGGGRPKVFKIALNHKLLGAFYYEGTEYEFNFSKFWTKSKTSFHCYETNEQIIWDVVQTTKKAKMEAQITCQKSDMILINYESPDGFKRHTRLWNGGTGMGTVKLYLRTKTGFELIDDIQTFNVGCEYGEYEK